MEMNSTHWRTTLLNFIDISAAETESPIPKRKDGKKYTAEILFTAEQVDRMPKHMREWSFADWIREETEESDARKLRERESRGADEDKKLT